MAQLVFVHGVATRDTQQYKLAVANRDLLFRELLFTGTDVQIHSPLWGGTVPDIASNVFATNAEVASFSLNIGPPPGMGAGMTGGARPDDGSGLSVVAVGKQDPVAALDAICSEIADRAAGQGRALGPEEVRAFSTASALIAADKAATLFEGQADGASIARQLMAGAPGTFGIGSKVGDAVAAVTDRIRNAASTLGFGAVRESLSPAVARFMGDVLVYLKEGETRDRIRAVIGKALADAHAAKLAGKGPIVLVGHSLGGVILVDMLSDPALAGLAADIEVDVLLTVGSQPGLFASLDVLTPNRAPVAPRRRPDCVKSWMNVFDAIDPLAFRASEIFKDVDDFVFNSMAGISDTHSKYFQRPQFYVRARKRLEKVGVL